MKQGSDIKPPVLPLRILRWFCDPEIVEDVEGDLLELYHRRSEEDVRKAKRKLATDVLLLFRPGIIRNFRFSPNPLFMFKNYLTVALRSAKRYRGHTALNLLSLIIGIASCLLILLWIQDEMRVDQFHENKDRIYKVWRNMHQSTGEILTTQGIPQPVVVSLRNDFPEVEDATLIGWDMETIFKRGDEVDYEIGRYVSPEFFRIFSYSIPMGNPGTALSDMTSVVISDRIAEKYFGKDWRDDNEILGETITIGSNQKDFQVSAVFVHPGNKSSLEFDWLINAQEYIQGNDWVESWYNGGFAICFTLQEKANLEPLQERILQLINENTNYEADERLFINRYVDNYLHSNFENGRPSGGRIQYVRILFVIAIFILVIACINFMNLATARSSRRTREIGVRKVLGAQKASLRYQFFIESFIMSITAVAVALMVVAAVLPYFNSISGKNLSLNLADPKLWIGLGVVTLLSGLLSGFYPAMLLPSFETTRSLKGHSRQSVGGIRLREGLVVFQFILSILLIAATLVVNQQMNYILNKNLGLDKENIIFTRLSRDLRNQIDVYKSTLETSPTIANVTTTSGNPLSYGRSSGSAQWAGKDPNAEVEINVMSVDENFVNTMGIEIVRGRDFDPQLATDTSTYLINQVAANIIAFEDPIDQDLTLWGQTGKIVGVIRDFHMSSMYEPIAPLIIRNDPSSTSVAFIRTKGDVQQALESIESAHQAFTPGYPFAYEFLDQDFAEAYRTEMTLSKIVRIFAFISILICCLGLFGLSSFSAEQRLKEIGIRKVYGANVMRIITLLSWGYTKLILIALFLAIPLSFYLLRQWLNNFEFRIELGASAFIAATVITLLIGAVTVGLKFWQAALTNPIQTLREE